MVFGQVSVFDWHRHHFRAVMVFDDVLAFEK
jgi:hypothetical protein